MQFSLIGIDKSRYATLFLQRMIDNNLSPDYVIVDDNNPINLANSAYYIDSGKFPDNNPDIWAYDLECSHSLITSCIANQIPFFCVPHHNSRQTLQVLKAHPIDILLLTEGPIIRGPVLYLPRYCVMNIHAAPLPQYRGNWTTRLALYNDEPPMVTAYVVTPWIDEGPILKKVRFSINHGDTLEQIDNKAMNAAIDLAINTILEIKVKGFKAKRQLIWEGNTYQGKYKGDELQPAMPWKLQDELRVRLEKGEYGFYDS